MRTPLKAMALAALTVATTLGMVGRVTTAQADPVKIRLGWVAAPASLVPILFPTDDIAKHNGKTYTIETTHFQGSPLQITALQSVTSTSRRSASRRSASRSRMPG